MKIPMESAIRFGSVSKAFGSVRAVESLTFAAPAGAVTVLLGPNGAGKTTTVRLTTGALVADRGDIEVLGLHPKVEGDEVRRRVGIVPPKPAFYDQLTGWENLVAESVGTHRGLQCEGRRIGGGRVPPIVEGALEEPVLRVW